MIRTQVYLPKTLYQQIDLVARREKKAKAAIIREAVARGLTKKHQETIGEALLKLAKISVKGGPKDLSRNIDKYLYEE